MKVRARPDCLKGDPLRIVDEPGGDYLCPKKSFRSIALPLALKRAVLAA
jgi:hypothetical protein